MRFDGSVVVITGASAGVGRATARAFAREGAAVALLARGEQRLDDARREIQSAGGRALVLPTDVADHDAVERAADAAEQQLGPIHIWVNNAMASVFAPVIETTAEEFRRVTEVTYLGYVHGTLAALRRMRPRDHGTIIQVGSALAYRSIPLQSAYCAAKHAVVGFTDSLRSELIHDRSSIRLTAVHLPAVNTPQFGWVKSRLPRKAQPVPPIYEPEVAASAILWAAANPSRRELLVGWPTVQAVWAHKLLPGLLDRILARDGYEGQQLPEPADPSRPTNLWRPAPGHQGAHGAFGARASESSPQLWLNTHRPVVGLAAAGLAAAAAGVAWVTRAR